MTRDVVSVTPEFTRAVKLRGLGGIDLGKHGHVSAELVRLYYQLTKQRPEHQVDKGFKCEFITPTQLAHLYQIITTERKEGGMYEEIIHRLMPAWRLPAPAEPDSKPPVTAAPALPAQSPVAQNPAAQRPVPPAPGTPPRPADRTTQTLVEELAAQRKTFEREARALRRTITDLNREVRTLKAELARQRP